MTISLKDFVQQALMEISEGVASAAAESRFPIGASGNGTKDAGLPFQQIDFDISVQVQKSVSGSGAGEGSVDLKAPLIGVVEGSLAIEGKAARKSAETHRVSFSVPIWFSKPSGRRKGD
ncbi:trypco2 family protein [Palleronia pelagia]|uniref:trypco2 family protein n=1 Tax=Palleronia pelagia TaxID=387096 RepID=UPI00111410FF|nr:trypco2 family protein [Palleronia pelagia]